MSAAAHVRAPLSLVLSLILFAGGAGTAFGQGVTAFAQPSAWEGPPLTLTEALREGLERNASLGLARARVAPLAYRSAQERSLVPPRIEAQIWQLPITTLNLAQADMYMFMLEQEFPGPGKRGLRAANAERELAVASAEFETQRLGTAGEIRRAYVTLALARRDLLAAFDTGRALEQLVELAQTTYATGSGSQVSVVRALLEVSRLQERIALLAGEERMGVARLNTLLGRSPDAAIGTLEEPRWDIAATARSNLPAGYVDRHPEVRAARTAVNQAQSAFTLAQQERRPDWMVQGGYMLTPGEAGAWTARVGITWPTAPWSRPRLDASIAEAARRREAAAAAVAAAESRVLVMVAEAAVRVDAASARLGVLRSALVPQAEHLVEATRLAFANAQGSMGDALEAQLLLLQAQLDEARAIRELELARADLSTAVGEEPLAPSTRGLTETSSSRVTDGPSGPGPLHGTPTRIPAGFQRNEREPSTQN
jgi:outer membrane protein, heavy metal efflux system